MPSVETDEVRHGDESMKISGWGKSLKVGGNGSLSQSSLKNDWAGVGRVCAGTELQKSVL